MKILVTGAGGFVGRSLCERLVRQGWLVRGTSRTAPRDTIRPEIEWVVVATVGSRTDWTAALEGVTHVVHLAAVAHVTGADESLAREIWEVNANGAIRLAECAARCGVERFVFLSSIGAVCSQSELPVSEVTKPAPDSPYGRSKLRAESGIIAALEGSRTKWTILRPALVFGPGNPGNMARLLRAVRWGLPLPFGSIHNRRSFVFVENLVDSIVLALTKEEADSRVFHVADPEVLSTPGLVDAIARACDKRAWIFRFPMRALRIGAAAFDGVSAILGDRRRRAGYFLGRLGGSLVVNSAAIRGELGWTQQVPFEDAIRRTLAAD